MKSDGSVAGGGTDGRTQSARKAFFSYFIKNVLQMINHIL